MDQEALEILRMVQEGRVSAEQGAKLLEALKAPPGTGPEAGRQKARFVRVHVEIQQEEGENVNVSLNLPLALADLALKLAEGMKIQHDGQSIQIGDYVAKLSGMDMGSILHMVKDGAEGKLVDVHLTEDERKIRVEVTVD